MILEYKKSFLKDLDKLGNALVADKLIEIIGNLKMISSIQEISNLKKMNGYEN